MATPESLANRVAGILGRPVEEIRLADVSMKLPFLTRHRVHMNRLFPNQTTFWLERPDGGLDQLPAEGAKAIEIVNSVLQAEPAIALDGHRPENPATLVRWVHRGGQGFLASKEFLAKQQPSLKTWIPPALGEEGKRLFTESSSDPKLIVAPDGTFELTFNWFNTAGGVEAWRGQGRGRAFSAVDVQQKVADRTFNYLFA
ncbi:MAG: hypothetical protein L6R30_04540 [Thermoanaerobaculia bacterium]|nr:hypothetical protein [Thermoanaerobaculia bacterium]